MCRVYRACHLDLLPVRYNRKASDMFIGTLERFQGSDLAAPDAVEMTMLGIIGSIDTLRVKIKDSEGPWAQELESRLRSCYSVIVQWLKIVCTRLMSKDDRVPDTHTMCLVIASVFQILAELELPVLMNDELFDIVFRLAASDGVYQERIAANAISVQWNPELRTKKEQFLAIFSESGFGALDILRLTLERLKRDADWLETTATNTPFCLVDFKTITGHLLTLVWLLSWPSQRSTDTLIIRTFVQEGGFRRVINILDQMGKMCEFFLYMNRDGDDSRRHACSGILNVAMRLVSLSFGCWNSLAIARQGIRHGLADALLGILPLTTPAVLGSIFEYNSSSIQFIIGFHLMSAASMRSLATPLSQQVKKHIPDLDFDRAPDVLKNSDFCDAWKGLVALLVWETKMTVSHAISNNRLVKCSNVGVSSRLQNAMLMVDTFSPTA